MMVSLTFHFSDTERRALADMVGKENRADRTTLAKWMRRALRGELDVIVADYVQYGPKGAKMFDPLPELGAVEGDT